MHQAVEQGVSDGGVADRLVPLGDGVLAGQERGAAADPVIDDLQQVAILPSLGDCQIEVIDDEEVQPGQGLEQAGQAAVGVSRLQGAKELGGIELTRPQALATGLVSQRAGQVAFSDPGGSGDDAVAMFLDPGRGAQLLDVGAFESARMTVVDVFEGGVGDLQLGVLEPRGQRAILLPKPLPFDQQPEAFLEVQIADGALAALFFEGFEHALQAHGP
jgi:hypothetical protein